MGRWQDGLEALGACEDARIWADKYKSLASAWAACDRANWMLWLLERTDADCRALVRTAALCAETALKYTEDARVEACIQVCFAWSFGEATDLELAEARSAAYAADAAAYAAATSAPAAAYAAYAAYAAASAYAAVSAYAYAYAASAAAYAAANAAAYAAAAYARMEALAKMANIVRANFPKPPRLP